MIILNFDQSIKKKFIQILLLKEIEIILQNLSKKNKSL